MIKLTNFIWSESVAFPKNKNVLRRPASGQVSSSVESPWALPWVGPRGSSCGEIRCLARGLAGVNQQQDPCSKLLPQKTELYYIVLISYYIIVFSFMFKKYCIVRLYWHSIHSICMDILSGCCKTRQLDSRNIVKACRFVAAKSLAWCSTAEPSGLWIAWDCHWRRRWIEHSWTSACAPRNTYDLWWIGVGSGLSGSLTETGTGSSRIIKPKTEFSGCQRLVNMWGYVIIIWII